MRIQSFTNCSGIVAAKRLGSSKTDKLDFVDSLLKQLISKTVYELVMNSLD